MSSYALLLACFTIAVLFPLQHEEDSVKTIDVSTAFTHEQIQEIKLKASVLPDVYDPRTLPKPCLPTIGYQGQCGCCFAFSASFGFMSRVCRAYNLSVPPQPNYQEMVSCDVNNGGCEGGNSEKSFRYASIYGLGPESCKFFDTNATTTAEIGACTYDTCDSGNVTTSKYFCKPGSVYSYASLNLNGTDIMEAIIKEQVFNNGPVSSSLIASEDFMAYRDISDDLSVFVTEAPDPNVSTDHSITIVGWGADYWIIANSWDTWWGNNGYAKVKKGILKLATSAEFCNVLVE